MACIQGLLLVWDVFFYWPMIITDQMYDAVLDSTFFCIKAVKYALICRKNKTYCCQKVRKRKYHHMCNLLVKVGVNVLSWVLDPGFEGLFVFCLLIRDFMLVSFFIQVLCTFVPLISEFLFSVFSVEIFIRLIILVGILYPWFRPLIFMSYFGVVICSFSVPLCLTRLCLPTLLSSFMFFISVSVIVIHFPLYFAS